MPVEALPRRRRQSQADRSLDQRLLGKRVSPWKRRIQDKGWSLTDAADFLGVSRQNLYNALNEAEPILLWQLAIAALPPATPELSRRLRAARQAARAARAAPVSPYAPRDVLICVEDCAVAQEGDEVVVADVRVRGRRGEFRLRAARGEAWLSQRALETHFVATGRTQ